MLRIALARLHKATSRDELQLQHSRANAYGSQDNDQVLPDTGLPCTNCRRTLWTATKPATAPSLYLASAICHACERHLGPMRAG